MLNPPSWQPTRRTVNSMLLAAASGPLLPQEQKDRGNQSARVADSDPPDEVNDRKAPSDRNLNAPDSHAHREEIGDGVQEQHH